MNLIALDRNFVAIEVDQAEVAKDTSSALDYRKTEHKILQRKIHVVEHLVRISERRAIHGHAIASLDYRERRALGGVYLIQDIQETGLRVVRLF